MIAEKFQIYSVKITANTFVSQKMDLFIFTHALKQNSPQGFLSLSSRQTGIAHYCFLKIFFPEEKGGAGGGGGGRGLWG